MNERSPDKSTGGEDNERMCGRYTLYTKKEALEERFHAHMGNYKESYNIAPSQKEPVILNENPEEIVLAKWGFMPHWAKGNSLKPQINARAETVAQKPMFRDSYRHRRCLILSDGFYEWDRKGETKTPYFTHLKSREPFAMAGIWDTFAGIPTYAIVTTAANKTMARIHDRMPVILSEKDEHDWLDSSIDEKDLLAPLPDKAMEMYPISRAVNAPKNNSKDLIAPNT